MAEKNREKQGVTMLRVGAADSRQRRRGDHRDKHLATVDYKRANGKGK